METVLHIYRRKDLARAVLEGKLIATCGADLQPPRTQGGTPIRPAGEGICIDCLNGVGPERALRILQRQQSKVTTSAGSHPQHLQPKEAR